MPRLFRYVQVTHLLALAAVLGMLEYATAATGGDVQRRIDADLTDDKPIVVHVVVALCDNVNQGIVPVPKAIGNGQDPGSNLYWGGHVWRGALPAKEGRLEVDRCAIER